MILNEWDNTDFYKKRYATPVKGRLLVFEEHGTDNHIFMAETWEQVSDAMIAKIIERADYGYYDCDELWDVPDKPFTDEQLAAAPPNMKKEYEKVMNKWKRDVEQVEDNNHMFRCISAAKNGNRSAAAHFFAIRADNEDKGFWLGEAKDPTSYMAKVKERAAKKAASKSC